MNLKDLRRNNKVWLLLGVVVGAVVMFGATSMFGMGILNHSPNVKYQSQASFLAPLVCGGIASQSWYLYSVNGQFYTNKTVGMCSMVSSPSCVFPAGYYSC